MIYLFITFLFLVMIILQFRRGRVQHEKKQKKRLKNLLDHNEASHQPFLHLEDRIHEYTTNCNEDFRGMVDEKCQLTGPQQVEIGELSQLAIWYRKEQLAPHLKAEFEEKIKQVNTRLSKEELIDLLCTVEG